MMKRKLLLFATFVAAVLPSNAAFYLSGTYNNGSSSNNDLKDKECLFVDEDGDGIFTYTLNLDNGYLEKFSVWDSERSERIGHDYGIRSGENITITYGGQDNIYSCKFLFVLKLLNPLSPQMPILQEKFY